MSRYYNIYPLRISCARYLLLMLFDFRMYGLKNSAEIQPLQWIVIEMHMVVFVLFDCDYSFRHYACQTILFLDSVVFYWLFQLFVHYSFFFSFRSKWKNCAFMVKWLCGETLLQKIIVLALLFICISCWGIGNSLGIKIDWLNYELQSELNVIIYCLFDVFYDVSLHFKNTA